MVFTLFCPIRAIARSEVARGSPESPDVRHEFPARAATSVGSFAMWLAFPTSRLTYCRIRHPVGTRRSPACPGRSTYSSFHPCPRCRRSITLSCPNTDGFIISLHPGTNGASRVLRRLSFCIPWPEDSGGPPHPSHSGCFVLPSRTLTLSASATSLSRSCTSTSGNAISPYGLQNALCTLALHCCSRLTPLRSRTNTRYGRVANPYPTGTFTPQETPSFARRDNVKPKAARAPDELAS